VIPHGRIGRPDAPPLRNWAGNVVYGTNRVHEPASHEQLQDVLKECTRLRPLGTRHSFNRIADSPDNLVSLRRLNRVLSLDRASRTVTAEAGMTYGELGQHLHANGHALANMASLPHISIAGAVATATHGSGTTNGNLATAISGIELVDAAGEVVTLTRDKDGDRFHGAVVSLGALGVVTKLTLDIEDTFDVAQTVYLDLPMRELERGGFDEIMTSGYSVSLFTDWSRRNINQLWIKRRVDARSPAPRAKDFHGARLATRNMHPVAGESAENVTDQMGIPGPWHERLPHFRMGFTPSSGDELQSEYFVPIAAAYDAIMAIEALHERITPHLLISEIRTIAADRLWLSPCHGRACVSLHTTWKPEWDAVMNLLPLIERALEPFGAVPHWGKLFTMEPAVLQSRYERLADFRELVGHYDPDGKFRNDFLRRNIGP
jgi:xylitol oxidase